MKISANNSSWAESTDARVSKGQDLSKNSLNSDIFTQKNTQNASSSSLRCRKMYFCCLTEEKTRTNRIWNLISTMSRSASVEQTKSRRRIWYFQRRHLAKGLLINLLKRQRCYRRHSILALVCSGRKKVKKYSRNLTRFQTVGCHETARREFRNV